MTKYLHAIKGRLRKAETEVKLALTTAYVRSLLIFITTPMVAARIIRPEELEKWERDLLRRMHLLPRDVDGRLIANLVRTSDPTQKTVESLANSIRL